MIWGAVAGTIPDLDVMAGLVADPITNLAFHRCVTHSLYYAVLGSPVLAWMAKALYSNKGNAESSWPMRFGLPGTLAIYLLIVIGSFLSPTPLKGIWQYAAVVAATTIAFPFLVWGFRKLKPRTFGPQGSFRDWLVLFFLCVATHPLLDCFTTYGTQVFQPFDDLRVAWNTISVADPAYTLPFLVLLLVASRLLRHNAWRRRLTWIGVGISSAYLIFTCFNLLHVRRQVEQDLAAQQIPYHRFVATPTLLQNVLWNVAIDQGDTILATQFGLLDEPFQLPLKHNMRAFAQRNDLLEPIKNERAVQVATWFADDWHVVSKQTKDTLLLMDLRFGILPGEAPSPIFGFQLYPRNKGEEWGFRQAPIREGVDMGQLFGDLWTRVKGVKATPLSGKKTE